MRQEKQDNFWKIWWWCHVGKLWRCCCLTDLWLIWSKPKAVFWSQPVKLTFSIIVTFYFTKFENRAKKSLTQLSHSWFEESYFVKKMLTFCKKCFLTSAKLRVSWYWKVYFLKLHMCLPICQISSFKHNSNWF